ncbi:hypothetical protein BD410DRAFT_234154 [Rickenella mellea]|uniref:Uncharacterized protein n=1 Tax=Rickenella mellea TaxID=50990 RepID=A0A4Y7QLT6_9AGAM|nr:hypothetical protein BD410DRAFT_234154 [Rickenella mellea]
MRDEFTAIEVPEDYKAEWIEVPDSHRFSLHPADIYHDTPIASSETTKNPVEGSTSEDSSAFISPMRQHGVDGLTGRRDKPGKSGKLVKFGPDTIDIEHKVPLQRPVIPRDVPPQEGSDKADRDPYSPEPDLPGIDPPRSSPPPELRETADPLSGSHGTARPSSVSADLKSIPDTNKSRAAEMAENSSKVVVSSSPPHFYVPALSVPRKPHVAASPGVKSNIETTVGPSAAPSAVPKSPNQRLEQAYIGCLDIIKSQMKFDDETVDILERLKVRGKKGFTFLGTVDGINVRVKYHLGQPSHCSVKIERPNNSAESHDSAKATALKPPTPLPKLKRLREGSDGETAIGKDCESAGGSAKKTRHE